MNLYKLLKELKQYEKDYPALFVEDSKGVIVTDENSTKTAIVGVCSFGTVLEIQTAKNFVTPENDLNYTIYDCLTGLYLVYNDNEPDNIEYISDKYRATFFNEKSAAFIISLLTKITGHDYTMRELNN